MHLSTIFCLAGVFLLLFWTVAVFLESQNIVGFGTIMEVICSSLHLSAGQGMMNCTGWPSQSPLQPFCRCFLRLKILSGCYHSRCWASCTPPALLQDRKTGHKQTSLCHSGFWPGFIRSHPSKLQVLSWESAAASFWGDFTILISWFGAKHIYKSICWCESLKYGIYSVLLLHHHV